MARRNLRKALDRCVLARHKLVAFKRWAVARGYQLMPTKGEYEVLRLMPPEGPVLIWFGRAGSFHITSATRESRLVRRWVQERGDGAAKVMAANVEQKEQQLG